MMMDSALPTQTAANTPASKSANKPLWQALKTAFKQDSKHPPLVQADDPDIARRAYTLQKKGVVVVPDFISAATCAQWQANIESLMAEHNVRARKNDDVAGVDAIELGEGARLTIRHSNDGKDAYDTGMVDCFHADKALPQLAEFTQHTTVEAIIAAASGQSVERLNSNFYFNDSVTNPRGAHMDTYGPPSYKAFVYLTDVDTLDCGPYTYYPGTHGATPWRYISMMWNTLRGFPLTDARLHLGHKAKPLLAKKGTLIISNQRGFHKGWPQAPGAERLLLVNNYKSVG